MWNRMLERTPACPYQARWQRQYGGACFCAKSPAVPLHASHIHHPKRIT